VRSSHDRAIIRVVREALAASEAGAIGVDSWIMSFTRVPSRLLGLYACALLATCAIGCSSTVIYPQSASSHLYAKTLPEFSRSALDGARIDVHELRGRAVVVKFFAEYCEPCKRTLPAVERLHKGHPTVAFVGVSEDDYATTARDIGKSFGLTFPIVHDMGKALKGRFRVSEMPVTFIADRQGVVRWVGGPGQTEAELAQAVEAAEQ
jgi:thiol-disulfide isomerase/thioredoxin